VRAIANTTISILGGTAEDEFGEQTDSGTVLSSEIPAAVTEQTRQMSTQENPTPHVVRFTVCRVGSDTQVEETNIVLDEGTGNKYTIQGKSQTGGFGMKNDLRLDLRRIT